MRNAEMCFGKRPKLDSGALRSKELDKVIKNDQKRMSREIKLLLLGNVTAAHGMVPS